MKISRGDSLDRFYLIKLFGFGVFLHRIHHSDPEGVFHSHPWNGVSLILGEYFEQYPKSGMLRRRGFNFIRAVNFHRTVVAKPVWTVFFHGRKCNKWSVWKDGRTVQTPWEGDKGHKSYTQALNS